VVPYPISSVKSKSNEAEISVIKGYREKIEMELAKICDDILDMLDKHLILSAVSVESTIFGQILKFTFCRGCMGKNC
jgi:hypothetical protein